jgi:hypothetical protein
MKTTPVNASFDLLSSMKSSGLQSSVSLVAPPAYELPASFPAEFLPLFKINSLSFFFLQTRQYLRKEHA